MLRLASLALALTLGCYEFHPVDPEARPDAAGRDGGGGGIDGGALDAGGGIDGGGERDGGRDAAVDPGFDAGGDPGVDGGMDAGVDAGMDAGMDAGLVECAPDPVCTIAQIAAGRFHTCARRESGTVECWGANFAGQLGRLDGVDRPRPTPVEGLEDPREIAAGGDRTCAVTADRGLTCWGDGRVATAIATMGVAQVAIGSFGRTCWRFEGAGGIDCLEGAFGFGAPTPVEGTAGALDLAVGAGHTCFVAEVPAGDPVVRCFGVNDDGQLGIGTTASTEGVVEVAGVEDAVQVTAGRFHSCALDGTGRVWCWGRNRSGQLGDGTRVDRLSPVPVVGLADVAFIAAGHVHTCARRRDGQVFCWGRNQNGQLGDGTFVDRPRPTRVGIGDALELGSGLWHSCARSADDTVRCWGSNNAGQLGDGTLEDAPSPVEVLDLP
ncbi:MAG TPA: hypothetical protein RMH85_23060 [Polyangiaceae bacterium LLY-WYZ-15_(1-7)]|nr:hypothetical protein [Polyangiaceae bacterium LLY-WYZ-15_(1-7)]HJL11374.1 hypothetical protein [Polyangiaceae bacterium LLY-WYZ-15_(1-7)]HJL27670.1 hypothetical protein [Polyangiaceae bacterium LLY-WYZ-15_(1-7)]